MNIKLLFNTYMQISQAEKKQKELDAMTAEVLNYGIIRDLINSAANNVTIAVTLKDGTKLDIKRDEPFDRIQKPYNEAF